MIIKPYKSKCTVTHSQSELSHPKQHWGHSVIYFTAQNATKELQLARKANRAFSSDAGLSKTSDCHCTTLHFKLRNRNIPASMSVNFTWPAYFKPP